MFPTNMSQVKATQPINAYKIKYDDGTSIVDIAYSDLDIIRKYDLATREHVNTRVIRLEGEQRAIVLDSFDLHL